MPKKSKEKPNESDELKVFSTVRVNTAAGRIIVAEAEKNKRSETNQAAFILEQWAEQQG